MTDDLCARLRESARDGHEEIGSHESVKSAKIIHRMADLELEAAARIAAQQNWHLAALYATCPGVTANDDAKAWQAQQIAAILQLIHRAEAAEARCAELADEVIRLRAKP